ncbi:hypothetical protein Tco_0402019 [Tanacetum coccineum]
MSLSLAKNVIIAGADNHPLMLDKTQYSSWASRMLLYIKGKENGKLLVDSVLNGPFVYGTVTIPRDENTPAIVRVKTYEELTDQEKLRESVDIKATNIEEGHMARQCTKPKRPKNSAWFKEKMLLTEALDSGATLDEEQLAFLEDNVDTVIPAQASQEIPSPAIFQTDDLDAFDSDCDDVPSAKAILMANLSS